MSPAWNDVGVVRRLVRDVAVALALLLLTWQIRETAEARGPQFQMSDVHVLEAGVTGFTKVDVSERAAAPQNNTSAVRSRSAFQIESYPPNLVFYLHGSPWNMENDITVGTLVRLEVLDDPTAQAERARLYPDNTFAQPLVSLMVGDEVISSASGTVARAEAAEDVFRRSALVAGVVALGWIGWAVWRWRPMLTGER